MTDDVVAELDAELALIEQLPYRVPIHLLAKRARDEIMTLRAMREAHIRMLSANNDDARAEALEEAARIAQNGCLVPPDGGSPTDEEREMCERIATAILALKERSL